MVVNGGSQRWPTTVNSGGPPSDHRRTTGQRRRTTARPPVNHQSTVVDRQSTTGSGRVVGRSGYRSWAGLVQVGLLVPPLVTTCSADVQLTWLEG
ncbi:hypothetical protein Tco_0329299 [Tanacetum coccineum]